LAPTDPDRYSRLRQRQYPLCTSRFNNSPADKFFDGPALGIPIYAYVPGTVERRIGTAWQVAASYSARISTASGGRKRLIPGSIWGSARAR